MACAAGAILSFQLAYASVYLSWLIVVYLLCLFQLARAATGRKAFYLGLAVGLLNAALQLRFFWTIFGPSAIALWLVLAFWIGLFVVLARLCLVRFGPVWTIVLAPFLWTGLEYFRSELYFLRFSWLNIGYAFSWNLPMPCLGFLGMYGVGFAAMAFAAALSLLRSIRARSAVLAGATAILALIFWQGRDAKPAEAAGGSIPVAGAQLEFSNDSIVLSTLNRLLHKSPEAQMLVLSEYTFYGPVPERIKLWCREHQRYLIVGGESPAPDSNYYNTAFVIGPAGEVVFQQAKAVPVQFFKDGLPAPEQKVWESPWGKIGICICYDLSYTRVTDRLIRLGARALIVPTMDVEYWGRRQHELHARVAPVRAAEYGVPIFRVTSSGISQLVNASGRVTAAASFPGQLDVVSGRLNLGEPGTLPFDRWLAPFATGVTGALILWFAIGCWKKKPITTPASENNPGPARQDSSKN
jgi:apolipoprotein N-acyltransferase